jgi:predicted short-subunit dehydrogenase-like oxidoreductase (DUF2520 family)
VDAPNAVGIVGAGHAGLALAVALARAGWPVVAVSSRDAHRRGVMGGLLPGSAIVERPAQVAELAGVVLLAVPDDAIGVVAAALDARSGSIVAHLSGVHPAGILRGRVPPGVAVGAFHPLVAFADVERAVMALHGGFVALDGDTVAVEALRSMARAIGARPVVLGAAQGGDRVDPATAKAAYHAAAVLAAGGSVALLDAIVELGRVAGLDETEAVEVYGSLIGQGLANATALGVAGALTGPIVRGDVGTVRTHLEAIAASTPDIRSLYLALARRQLAIASEHGGLDATAAATFDELLVTGGDLPGAEASGVPVPRSIRQ